MVAGRTAVPSHFPILWTERLILREITPDDAGFWLRDFSDSDVVELTAYEPPTDVEAARAEIEQFCVRPFREGTGIRWGITRRGESDLIGTLGYHNWVQGRDRRARVGYDLLAEHRRQGIMSEALGIVLAYGFKTMALNRVEAAVDPRNQPSIRLLERLGFHRDACLREATWFRGAFLDDVVYSLLAREWRGVQEAKR
jgi:ribosomal-protein-alanine N-acetyltransferase